ncbi:hypothetical protein H1P_1980009 [Hyella patelloides LEGE 07179]|uniref:Uncharacterized protein n=2 Tax=Hyella TaxID=945733 RepID=A0A563VPN5_9CYAN|nr:hypothetical protein H1P_1980009 [Hyella patelloides LEGE 07179]
MPNSLKSRMNESLMYGSVDQPKWRHFGLSSTTYATGDLPSWSVGASLLVNGESLNVESPTKSNDEAKSKSVV